MVSAIGIPLMPWLDTSKIPSAIFRSTHRQWFIIFVLNFPDAYHVGAMSAEGIRITLSRIGTAYWFCILVILFINWLVRKPKEMPHILFFLNT